MKRPNCGKGADAGVLIGRVAGIAVLVMLAIGLLGALLAIARLRRPRYDHCLSHLKQIGLAMMMYSQDYRGFFPRSAALDEDVTAIGCLSLLRPNYASAQKSFICPTDLLKRTTKYAKVGESGAELPLVARDLERDEARLDVTGCSYAYGIGFTEADNPDFVIACDRMGKPGTRWSYSTLTGTPPPGEDVSNHDINGINVVFVGGHAKWIPTVRCHADKERDGLFPNINNPARSRGAVMNP